MAIRLISDVHLEFQGLELPPLPTDSEDILVCAGDIGIGLQGADWVSSMSDRFKAIVYVAGNHEFYNGHYTKVRNDLSEYLWPDNVHYLHGGDVRIGEFVFIGATLWTDNNRGDPNFEIYVSRHLNDYSYIQYGNGTLRPSHTHRLHQQDYEDIVTKLSQTKAGERVIVVTHHLPSLQCVHIDYRGSRLNPAYASDMDDLIYYYKPNLWLFGHTHKTCNVKIGSTLMRSNPRGYSRGENSEFDPYLRIL